MVAALDDADEVFSPPNSESGTFTEGLTPAIDGNQKIMTAAFYFQCDFPLVANDNGAYV